jgi:hypothetical protein
MAIFINPHALERAAKRGTHEEEIIEVWLSGLTVSAKYGRKGKAKIFDFKAERLEQFYEQKRVEIFYIEEGDDIIIITVYVFYGKWE